MCYDINGDFMRLRNLKNKETIIDSSNYVIKNYKDYIGSWKSVFNNDNPIYIEIGMGRGKFIVENALKNPNINYIGIEKQDNIIARSLLWIPEDIPNLKIIRMDALEIDEVFKNEIDCLYLNFSDPWPKVRHNRRRLTSKIFLDKYDSILKSNSIICLRTDNEPLYTYSIETLSEHGYSLYDVTFDLHRDFSNLITTEYEDKFNSMGNKIYALKARK